MSDDAVPYEFFAEGQIAVPQGTRVVAGVAPLPESALRELGLLGLAVDLEEQGPMWLVLVRGTLYIDDVCVGGGNLLLPRAGPT